MGYIIVGWNNPMRRTLPRGARCPTGWGRGSGLLPTGALPRGLGLSLEKAQTKEHQGAAAPWTPGGIKVLAPARRVLGL